LGSLRSRWSLLKIITRFFVNMIPPMLSACVPGHHPFQASRPLLYYDVRGIYGRLRLVSYATFYSAVVGATITTGICLTNALRAARKAPQAGFSATILRHQCSPRLPRIHSGLCSISDTGLHNRTEFSTERRWFAIPPGAHAWKGEPELDGIVPSAPYHLFQFPL
jgi:hypothetical protein